MLKNTLIKIVRPLFRNYVYVIKTGLAQGLKRKGGLGFIPLTRPPSREQEFLRNIDFKGKTVYDIGGYEGIFTLFFAREVGEHGMVITFEPNPVSYRKIIDNVKVNQFDNVKVFNFAIGERKSTAKLVLEDFEVGTGEIMSDNDVTISSMKGKKYVQVEIDSIDGLIYDGVIPKPQFIKIDVEGFELEVLKGAATNLEQSRPQLFIEIHGDGIENKKKNLRNIVEFLSRYRYEIVHVESGLSVSANNYGDAYKGHLYCK